MKVNNHITNRLGKVSADIFFEIGDKINLVNIKKTKGKNNSMFFKEDYDALKNDWNSVGKEVLLAFGRFEEEYKLTRK